jgi:hypothetical protein
MTSVSSTDSRTGLRAGLRNLISGRKSESAAQPQRTTNISSARAKLRAKPIPIEITLRDSGGYARGSNKLQGLNAGMILDAINAIAQSGTNKADITPNEIMNKVIDNNHLRFVRTYSGSDNSTYLGADEAKRLDYNREPEAKNLRALIAWLKR